MVIKSDHRVVASLTTIPYRYNLLEQCIKSLLNQTYKLSCIYITVPLKSARYNIDYPPLPKFILDHELCKIITPPIDYGPLCKIYGALYEEQNDDTLILYCDDDTILQNTHVEYMIKNYLLFPNKVICGTGSIIANGNSWFNGLNIHFNITSYIDLRKLIGLKNGSNVDIPYGVGTVLCSRKLYPTIDNLYDELFKYSMLDINLFKNDDIVIAAYFNSKKIKCKVFNNIPLVIIKHSNYSLYTDNSTVTFNNSIKLFKSMGFFKTTEPMPSYSSLIFYIVIYLIFLYIFILILIYLVNNTTLHQNLTLYYKQWGFYPFLWVGY